MEAKNYKTLGIGMPLPTNAAGFVEAWAWGLPYTIGASLGIKFNDMSIQWVCVGEYDEEEKATEDRWAIKFKMDSVPSTHSIVHIMRTVDCCLEVLIPVGVMVDDFNIKVYADTNVLGSGDDADMMLEVEVFIYAVAGQDILEDSYVAASEKSSHVYMARYKNDLGPKL